VQRYRQEVAESGVGKVKPLDLPVLRAKMAAKSQANRKKQPPGGGGGAGRVGANINKVESEESAYIRISASSIGSFTESRDRFEANKNEASTKQKWQGGIYSGRHADPTLLTPEEAAGVDWKKFYRSVSDRDQFGRRHFVYELPASGATRNSGASGASGGAAPTRLTEEEAARIDWMKSHRTGGRRDPVTGRRELLYKLPTAVGGGRPSVSS